MSRSGTMCRETSSAIPADFTDTRAIFGTCAVAITIVDTLAFGTVITAESGFADALSGNAPTVMGTAVEATDEAIVCDESVVRSGTCLCLEGHDDRIHVLGNNRRRQGIISGPRGLTNGHSRPFTVGV